MCNKIKSNNLLNFYFFILLLFYFLLPFLTFAASDSSGTIINLDVHNCNENGLCEPQYGENYPACPLDCNPDNTPINPPHHPSTSGNPGPQFFDSEIVPNSLRVSSINCQTTVIEWQTYGLAQESLGWGRTADAEEGSVTEIGFRQFHSFQLVGLSGETLYYFNIKSIDRYSHTSYFNNQYFITPPCKKLLPPTTTVVVTPSTITPPTIEGGTPTPVFQLTGQCNWWWCLYLADYYVAYFFGFINYVIWIVIHI